VLLLSKSELTGNQWVAYFTREVSSSTWLKIQSTALHNPIWHRMQYFLSSTFNIYRVTNTRISATGRAIRCSNPSRGKRFSSVIFFRPAVRPTGPRIHFVLGLFRGGNDRGVILTTHFRLAQRLKMSGCVLLLPLYAIMVWRGTNLQLILLQKCWACSIEFVTISYLADKNCTL